LHIFDYGYAFLSRFYFDYRCCHCDICGSDGERDKKLVVATF